MSLFVLDTDILTLFEREHPTIVARIAEHAPADIANSVVTVEEQLSGWFLKHPQILDFDMAAMQRYEEVKRLRLKVRKMDLQIAATALEHGGTVVTRNVRDFKAVPGLAVENWSK